MLIHIVKTGETVDKIIDSYRILKSDLISNNLHITDFSHLKSGMKLKIPLISKDTIEVLEESEAFIDDYYPSFEKFLSANEKISDEKIIEVKEEYNKEITTEEYIDVKNEVVENKESDKEENVEKNFEKKQQISEPEETKIPYNNNVYRKNYNPYYNGNVIPNLNQNFIKKI